jgi:hypothetical protein
MSGEQKSSKNNPVRAIFAQFDKDQKGVIKQSEFQDLAFSAGIALDDQQAIATFNILSGAGSSSSSSSSISSNGLLTLEQFTAWWLGESQNNQAPVSTLLWARLVANHLSRSLHHASTLPFWAEEEKGSTNIRTRCTIGTLPSNIQPMEINLTIQPSNPEVKKPTLSFALNIEDNVSDFSLGSAIGSIQTLLDAAIATSEYPLPISVKIADPKDRQLIIRVEVNDLSQLPTGPPVDINISQLISCFVISFKFGQCFETLFGEDSKLKVFGDSFSMDVSTKVEINKKFTRLLKHMLSIHNKTTSTHPSLQYSNQQLNLFSVAPFLFPLVLNNINIEINFDTVFELVNEIIKDTSDELYGEEMQNSLLTRD